MTLDLFLVVLQQLHLLMTVYWSIVVLQKKLYNYISEYLHVYMQVQAIKYELISIKACQYSLSLSV